MSLLFGDIVFDFEVDIMEGCIWFYDWIGDDWVVFFLYFVDFILVCMIEFGYMVKFKDKLVECGVKVLVILVDMVEVYMKWIEDIEDM